MTEELKGLLRHLLTFGAGILVARGKLDVGSAETLVGAVLTGIGFIWSWLAKKQAA